MMFNTPATTNPIDQLKVVGKPLDRIDGRLKTTGTAPYAYERHDVAAGQAYGYVVGSAIAKGRIVSIDLRAARAAPGVVAIVTAEDAPRLGKASMNAAWLIGGPDIQHYHQAIALVVAETFEQARAAARHVKVTYEHRTATLSLTAVSGDAKPPGKLINPEIKAETKCGDVEQGKNAAARIDTQYLTSNLHNNPMEPHAALAVWTGDGLTLYDSTQNVNGTQRSMAVLFDVPKENVRVVAQFIGGGFGCKGPPWEHTTAAVMAAK